jgi:hypothetical protein
MLAKRERAQKINVVTRKRRSSSPVSGIVVVKVFLNITMKNLTLSMN